MVYQNYDLLGHATAWCGRLIPKFRGSCHFYLEGKMWNRQVLLNCWLCLSNSIVSYPRRIL